MRRVFRRELSARAARELDREQQRADTRRDAGTLHVEAEWKRARRNKPLHEAFTTLRTMAGNRERCMYCGDSHGTDIEHFWPKTPFPERMFRWANMLLCCAECGRFKGDRFPLDNAEPTLIDPSSDAPWDFLDFDPATGNIVARYNLERQRFEPKGERTVEVLHLDRREAMARGYQRSFRRIKAAFEKALEQSPPDATKLIGELLAADDHDLLGWCFDGLGSREQPFRALQEQHPAVWQECLHAYQQYQGAPPNYASSRLTRSRLPGPW